MEIIRHNCSFSFMEHEINRENHIVLNPDVKPIFRNTTKSDLLKIYMRERKSQTCFRVSPGQDLLNIKYMEIFHNG